MMTPPNTLVTNPLDIDGSSTFEEVLAYAESIKETFYKIASESIVLFGFNSAIQNLDELKGSYFMSLYFRKVSRKISDELFSEWVHHSYNESSKMLQELDGRIMAFRNSLSQQDRSQSDRIL